jgi:hypothetical protein
VTTGSPADSITVDGCEWMAGPSPNSGNGLLLTVPVPRSSTRPPLFIGAALAGFAIVLSACGNGSSTSAPTPGFYVSPRPLTSSPGTLLRYQPLGTDVPGGRAYRILYVSATSDGRPRTSGGVLVVPDRKPPATGRPIVAWAHPVIDTNVAPSQSASPLAAMDPWLTSAVRNGWIVVATDFVAVGTHQQETFVGRAEANDIGNSVLAATHLPDVNAGTAWVVFGESSGGHGALWSGSIAPALAPGLHLLGVAAVAPVAELVQVEQAEGKPWAPALLAQTPPPLAPSVPAFIAQGTQDDVVPASTTVLLQRQWCSAGSRLYVDWLKGVTHDGAIGAASRSAVAWMKSRFRGLPAPSNCSADPPVIPASG